LKTTVVPCRSKVIVVSPGRVSPCLQIIQFIVFYPALMEFKKSALVLTLASRSSSISIASVGES